MAKMNDFLLQYFKQLHFNRMEPEIRSRFDDYRKRGDLVGNMKEWTKTLMDADGKNLALPDPTVAGGEWELDNNELTKLFNAFQDAFRALDANRGNFKYDKKVKEFIDENFGETKLFSLQKISDTTVAHIDNLYKVMTDTATADMFYSWVAGAFESRPEYNEFVDAIKAKKYKTDTKVRDKLIRIVNSLNSSMLRREMDTAPQLANALASANLAEIVRGFDDDGRVYQSRLDDFKAYLPSLLNKLHDDKKVRDAFAQYGGSGANKIIKPFNEAISRVDYENKDSDDYLVPKASDKLNLKEQISKWASDTYENYFEKYVKLRPDRLFFSPYAGMIFKAIDANKIKPTDGLAAVIKGADDIKKKLMVKSPNAVKQFDWMIKALKDIQSRRPKAFAGALQDGPKMRIIIGDLITRAVDDGKDEAAQTAMEVLSVMKYGWTTSKIMDALRGTEFTLFSDGKLSWNKNEGMAFVSKAVDKGIRAAFLGLGYAVTIAGNAIRKNGSKFNGRADRMSGAYKDWQKNNTQDKAALQQRINDATRARDAENQKVSDITATTGMDATNLQQYAKYQSNRAIIDDYTAKIKNAQDFIEKQLPAMHGVARSPLSAYLNQLYNEINNMPSGTSMPGSQEMLWQQFLYIQQWDADIQQATTNVTTARAGNTYLGTNPDAAEVADKIYIFENATQYARELDTQITEMQEKLAKWDETHTNRIEKLAAYWDRLETGRDSMTGPMYSWFGGMKRRQANRFDKTHEYTDSAGKKHQETRAQMIMRKYSEKYTLAA